MDEKKKHLLILGIIIFAGFLLRLYKITFQSLWIDEAFSIYHSQQNLMDVVLLKDPSPPLYLVLLHFWIQLTGISEFTTRLLSVFFGTVSIFIIYLIGSKIFNKTVGIYSAILLAVSPVNIYFSQEVRTYSLFFLLVSLSMYSYLKLNDLKVSRWTIAGYFVSTILMLYSHFYAIFILAVQNIHQLTANNTFHNLFTKFQFSKKLRSWILIQIIVLITFIPWLIQLASIILMRNYSWIPKPSLLDLVDLIYSFFSGRVNSIFGTLLALACIFTLFKLDFKNKKLQLLLIWIAVPILIPLFYSLVFTPIFTAKYVYFVSLPLFILISLSIFSMKKITRVIFLLALVILSLSTLYMQQNTITKDPWDKVADYINQNYKEYDKIVIMNSYEIMPFSYYYDNVCFQNNEIYNCFYHKGVYGVDTVKEIKGIPAKNMWLVVSREEYNPEVSKVLTYTGENYIQLDSKEFLLNQNPFLPNIISKYFVEINSNQSQFNKIRLFYFQRK